MATDTLTDMREMHPLTIVINIKIFLESVLIPELVVSVKKFSNNTLN